VALYLNFVRLVFDIWLSFCVTLTLEENYDVRQVQYGANFSMAATSNLPLIAAAVEEVLSFMHLMKSIVKHIDLQISVKV